MILNPLISVCDLKKETSNIEQSLIKSDDEKRKSICLNLVTDIKNSLKDLGLGWFVLGEITKKSAVWGLNLR